MEIISSLLAAAALVLALLSLVAVFFPKLAKTERSSSAFMIYFFPAIAGITIALAITPTTPSPPGVGENLVPVGSDVKSTGADASQLTTITSTGDDWACVTEGALIKLVASSSASDRETASTMLGEDCFQTRDSWTIHVHEEKENSVSYSRDGDTVSWTTPDNIKTKTF